MIFPREPAHLKDGWWEDSSHVETLCALVVWRDWIDQVADDPWHELAFHVQLGDYSRNFAKRAVASRGHGCQVRRPTSGLAGRSLGFWTALAAQARLRVGQLAHLAHGMAAQPARNRVGRSVSVGAMGNGTQVASCRSSRRQDSRKRPRP